MSCEDMKNLMIFLGLAQEVEKQEWISGNWYETI